MSDFPKYNSYVTMCMQRIGVLAPKACSARYCTYSYNELE